MNSGIGRFAAQRSRGGAIAALGLALIIHMGSGGTARALQVLEASDHAELLAEISDTDVNRIALDGDRISRVIQSPGGFTVEHDPVGGDLYLYPESGAGLARRADSSPGPARATAPVTLYLGTEQGFTYRLSLSAVSRDSAQILIRNAAVAAARVNRTAPVGSDHRSELVSLILAVARREPLPGYAVVPASVTGVSAERGSVLELWRGPRFVVRVLSVPAAGVDDAARLARLTGANVVASWLSPPGSGPNGERLAVLVEDSERAELVR